MIPAPGPARQESPGEGRERIGKFISARAPCFMAGPQSNQREFKLTVAIRIRNPDSFVAAVLQTLQVNLFPPFC